MPLGGKTAQVTISITALTVKVFLDIGIIVPWFFVSWHDFFGPFS